MIFSYFFSISKFDNLGGTDEVLLCVRIFPKGSALRASYFNYFQCRIALRTSYINFVAEPPDPTHHLFSLCCLSFVSQITPLKKAHRINWCQPSLQIITHMHPITTGCPPSWLMLFLFTSFCLRILLQVCCNHGLVWKTSPSFICDNSW